MAASYIRLGDNIIFRADQISAVLLERPINAVRVFLVGNPNPIQINFDGEEKAVQGAALLEGFLIKSA